MAEFMRMDEVGLFGEDERVELIRGEIVEMSPINVPHPLCVNRLTMLLAPLLVGRAIVSVQNPIQLDDLTLPQPDIALWNLARYEEDKVVAGPSQLFLVIEVADSSIAYDRRAKGVLYAGAGIADYWIVNLQANVVEVYREPRPDGYRTVTRYRPGGTLSPLAFPDVVLLVDDVLGSEI
jgi:Uma2 family endonuclease